jgi:serine O-acetyltransferase
MTMPQLLILKWRLKRILLKLGFTIPRRVFGPGLSIAHHGTITVSPKARVGRNCRLHQGVTIGQLHGRSCRIGDNVWIGPGAVIYGDISIGDHVVIGANAVVGSDVESGVTVGGVPAVIVSDVDSSELVTDGCAIAAGRTQR